MKIDLVVLGIGLFIFSSLFFIAVGNSRELFFPSVVLPFLGVIIAGIGILKGDHNGTD